MLKLNSWGTTPKYDLATEKSWSISLPKTKIFPLVFFVSDEIILIIVDFPAPLGPKRAKKSPSATSKVIPFKASVLPS